ncbi:hypothetical protein EVJ32_10670 [Exiguobacterium sp. SH5S4]|uniref:conjugal transfer protein TrbL family protein n=1 Tax=Exiguobacterium sp. SH5S4 TaxID=2510961 RepID=UPI00103EF89C|nr:conjugal transfer protein TrbL family protein [Exiguobacterium sp. SH5S4]TCI25256.1 hypothetical protein EVJ32_10670 [Exiguobacterium sp. SH5S4]
MKRFRKIASLVLCILLLSSISVSAKEGEFYKRNKATFDQYKGVLSEDYIDDFVKKYDSNTNTFNCGTLDFTCYANSHLYSGALGMATGVTEQMKIIVRDPALIVKDPAINRYKGYLTTLANSLLPLFVIWHMMVMALRRLGDPDDYQQAMNQKMLGFITGAIMLGLYNPIFNIILDMQNQMLQGIVNGTMNKDALMVMIFTWSPSYSLVLVIFVVLAMLIFGLAVLYRFVALSFMFMVGPLAISTILNDEFNYFNVWWKYIWNNIVTFALQAIAYAFCIQVLTNQNSYVRSFPYMSQGIVAISMVLVISFFSLTIPFILGNLGSSSGTGRSIGRVARVLIKR